MFYTAKKKKKKRKRKRLLLDISPSPYPYRLHLIPLHGHGDKVQHHLAVTLHSISLEAGHCSSDQRHQLLLHGGLLQLGGLAEVREEFEDIRERLAAQLALPHLLDLLEKGHVADEL